MLSNSKKAIEYSPQPNATSDEVMQALKVFGWVISKVSYEGFWKNFNELPPEVKRHFTIKSESSESTQ